jgi:hypothetical protein
LHWICMITITAKNFSMQILSQLKILGLIQNQFQDF